MFTRPCYFTYTMISPGLPLDSNSPLTHETTFAYSKLPPPCQTTSLSPRSGLLENDFLVLRVTYKHCCIFYNWRGEKASCTAFAIPSFTCRFPYSLLWGVFDIVSFCAYHVSACIRMQHFTFNYSTKSVTRDRLCSSSLPSDISTIFH